MPPNFEEADGAYWFWVVHLCMYVSVSSRNVHARVLKFHIWIPHGNIFDTHFFSCPSCLPFWVMRLWKIWMKSDACHTLWTMHARVLKFHVWIPHGKIADPYFFSCLSHTCDLSQSGVNLPILCLPLRPPDEAAKIPIFMNSDFSLFPKAKTCFPITADACFI